MFKGPNHERSIDVGNSCTGLMHHMLGDGKASETDRKGVVSPVTTCLTLPYVIRFRENGLYKST